MRRQRLTEKFAAAANSSKIKTESKKKTNGSLERNTDGFEYDKSKANVLKKALHNLNVSLGTLISAMKDLALIRGSDLTPDGQLGGRGFIMSFRDIKAAVNEAVNNISDVTDTLADELTNPKWGLTKTEVKKVKQEKKNVEDKVEEIDEKELEEKKPDVKKVEEVTDLNPEDVKDSADVEALKRYSDYVNGIGVDEVASKLSRNIMATILRK